MLSTQMSMFETAEVEVEKPVPPTTVHLGRRVARVNLHKKRREALKKLKDTLSQLEGKDVCIGSYGGSSSHFWLHNLKLQRLQVTGLENGDRWPSVLVLWGRKEASVRIFTDQLINVREQEYQGYTLWLVDFWNGFGEYPINRYRPPGYVSLQIAKFKD